MIKFLKFHRLCGVGILFNIYLSQCIFECECEVFVFSRLGLQHLKQLTNKGGRERDDAGVLYETADREIQVSLICGCLIQRRLYLQILNF